MIGNRKITVAAALITLAACLFTLVFLLWPQSLHITAASSSPDYLSLFDPMEVLSVEITVDEGDSVSDVAKKLKDAGLVNSKGFFQLASGFLHYSRYVEPGTYNGVINYGIALADET